MAKKKPATPNPKPIGFRLPMPDEAGDVPAGRPDEDDDLDSEEGLDEPPPDQDDLTDLVFLELMAEIGKRFEPAATLDEAGLQLTTGQVHERLRTFYPADTYTAKMVFDALYKLGFKYEDPFRDMQFVWLFR